ncbi:hypothetical protein [Lysinibacillus xylanilyticus]|nr:hypothetical protein [Lysinibacillus xylanilyticus]
MTDRAIEATGRKAKVTDRTIEATERRAEVTDRTQSDRKKSQSDG